MAQTNQDTFFITLTPRQLPSLQPWRAAPALLAYRLGPGPHLYRAGSGPLPRGGLMVVNDGDFDGLGDAAPLSQEIVRECQARGFVGAVLDFEGRLPPLAQIVRQLDEPFARRDWRLFVPEDFAPTAPHTAVMIPSSLSGGSLELRLEEAVERFGPARTALALEKAAEDFTLPAPTGCGTPLSPKALAQLKERLSPSVFFSGDLCARYFTYMDGEGRAHFVLFDDEDTLRRKVEVARRAGIHTFLAAWDQVSSCAAHIGIQRYPSSRNLQDMKKPGSS